METVTHSTISDSHPSRNRAPWRFALHRGRAPLPEHEVGNSFVCSTTRTSPAYLSISASMSRTALSRPTRTARATMACPMFSSVISGMATIGRTLS